MNRVVTGNERRGGTSWLVGIVLLALTALPTVPLAATAPASKVLILHDSSGDYGWLGGLYARMLANLLGHFSLPWEIAPVENYAPGSIENFRACFYFGAVYDNPLPAAFLNDVRHTTRPVCWSRYNLWQLAESFPAGTPFEERYGFRFDYLDAPVGSEVAYKGERFAKDSADPELGRTTLTDPTRATAVATVVDPAGTPLFPYLTRGSNLWYVADTPFSYIGEEDRYLVFCDALHEILNILHPESHPALIRLEDVSPAADLAHLRLVIDELKAQSVPFAIATIPVHADPFGYDTDGVPVWMETAQTPAFYKLLKYALQKGGQLVLHGYTHQLGTRLNPYNAVSGDDYEFYRVAFGPDGALADFRPIEGETPAWVQGRLSAAKQQLASVGLSAAAFEVPHYAASPTGYRTIAANFPLTIQRVLYADESGHLAGQFYPYLIERDVYGQRVAPENLGNISPNAWQDYPARLPEDLLRAARKNRVLRDSWASFYFHPYLDLAYLRETVAGIKALGFTFTPLSKTSPPSVTTDPRNLTRASGTTASFTVSFAGGSPLKYQWRFNGQPLPGAVRSTYSITNVQPAHAGTYSILLSNAYGTAVSLPATLTVTTAPTSP